MDDLRRMAIFAAVVEHRSMSAAARALGTSPSAVSQQVRQLEQTGGVTLLHRTTRKLTLTAAGERFHVDCAAMVTAARRAQAQLAMSRDAPVGELRVSAPVGFARHVSPALGDCLVPSLILQCAEDHIAPEPVGRWLADHLPHSTYHALEATGHCPHLTHPDEIIRVIRSYLECPAGAPALSVTV